MIDVVQAVLHEAAAITLKFTGRPRVDLSKDTVWVVYVCLGCDMRRAGLPNLVGGHCRVCGPDKGTITEARTGLTFLQAMEEQNVDAIPVGLHVLNSLRKGSNLSTQDCLEAKRAAVQVLYAEARK